MSNVATQASADPIATLIENAPRYEFVQLVRLIERWLVLNHPNVQTTGLVGTDALPGTEPIRFAAAPSLGFAATQVQALKKPGDALPLQLVVNFIGLIGPAGVLPRHYTATAIKRHRDKDDAFVELLDLFHSRLIGLFYRAFARYHAATAHEARDRNADLLTQTLRSAVGFDETGPLRGLLSDAAEEADVLGFAGLYAHGRRNATALRQMLAAQLRLPVAIQQFVGQWLDIPIAQRSRLPLASGSPGMHHRLGANAILGSRVWDVVSRFCVRVGPLMLVQYIDFLPGGRGLRRAGLLTRMYVRQEFDVLIRPILRAAEVPVWKLGGAEPTRQQLGRTVWLRSPNRPFQRDFDAAAYSPPTN